MLDGRHQVFADAALDEAAIELDVVDVTDDDDLGAGVADLRQPVEFGLEPVARQLALDDDQVGRRGRLIEFGWRRRGRRHEP